MDPTTYQQACHSRLEPLPLLLFSRKKTKIFFIWPSKYDSGFTPIGPNCHSMSGTLSKLLDEAEAKENEELRLAGPSDDIHRLQPAGPVLCPIEMFR